MDPDPIESFGNGGACEVDVSDDAPGADKVGRDNIPWAGHQTGNRSLFTLPVMSASIRFQGRRLPFFTQNSDDSD